MAAAPAAPSDPDTSPTLQTNRETAVRFSANLTFLFKDAPFAERFARARDAGLPGVEFMWPGEQELAAVERAVAETGLEVALLNFDAGDVPARDRGLSSDPDFELEAQLELAHQNVAWAAEQAQAQGATIMIEAANSYENGPYLLDTTAKAVNFLDAVGADNVALQYDVYHMQRTEGTWPTRSRGCCRESGTCREGGRRHGATARRAVRRPRGNRATEVRRRNFLEHDFTPGFKLELHHKDLGIALRTARELGV